MPPVLLGRVALCPRGHPGGQSVVFAPGIMTQRDWGRPMSLRFAEPIRVLVVEDNPVDAKVVEAMIRTGGFAAELRRCEDGLAALACLRATGADAYQPDVILLDLSLPRLRGTEVIATMNADPELSTIPVVIMTSSDERDDVLLETRIRVGGYLRKPIDQAKLVDVLVQIENQARLKRLGSLG